MGFNQTSWKAGEGPSKTRSGIPNRNGHELRERLKSRGGIDPAEFLHGLVSDENESKELRAQASNMLMPYLYNKLAPIAPPPTLILLEEQVVIPHQRPTTLVEVRENIAYLSQLKSDGRIDRTWAESLIFDQRALNDSLVDEAELLAGVGTGDQIIRIEGGLPALPGSDIIMPVLAADPASGPGPLAPTKDYLSPLDPAAPVVAITKLQQIESALFAWAEGGRKGDVEIDGKIWDAMATVPRDALQALFDRYGVACPEVPEGDGAGEGAAEA
jgi:hypothetical protein